MRIHHNVPIFSDLLTRTEGLSFINRLPGLRCPVHVYASWWTNLLMRADMTYCQVFEFGRLFPKLQLSQEGLLKVCVFLQKVCMLLGKLVFQPGDDLASRTPHFETIITFDGQVVRTDCASLQDTEGTTNQ